MPAFSGQRTAIRSPGASARKLRTRNTRLGRFDFDAGETADVEPHAALAATRPETADPRQNAPLCAAWTAGSLRHLAGAGADAVTFFEAIGWRGVIQDPRAGTPAGYPPGATCAFPAYHVPFADREVSISTDALPTDASIRCLDEASAAHAAEDPEGFRSAVREVRLPLSLRLAPYAVATLDGRAPAAGP